MALEAKKLYIKALFLQRVNNVLEFFLVTEVSVLLDTLPKYIGETCPPVAPTFLRQTTIFLPTEPFSTLLHNLAQQCTALQVAALHRTSVSLDRNELLHVH